MDRNKKYTLKLIHMGSTGWSYIWGPSVPETDNIKVDRQITDRVISKSYLWIALLFTDSFTYLCSYVRYLRFIFNIGSDIDPYTIDNI